MTLTHVDEWPLRDIQPWSFDHMVEVVRARFEPTIKQAAHRQAWHALTRGAKESPETLYDRFTRTHDGAAAPPLRSGVQVAQRMALYRKEEGREPLVRAEGVIP